MSGFKEEPSGESMHLDSSSLQISLIREKTGVHLTWDAAEDSLNLTHQCGGSDEIFCIDGMDRRRNFSVCQMETRGQAE